MSSSNPKDRDSAPHGKAPHIARAQRGYGFRSSVHLIVLALVCGLTAGVLLFAELAQDASYNAELPKVSLLGKPLQLDAKTPKRALLRLRTRFGGVFSLTLPNGQEERVSYGDLGVEIDKGRLTRLLRDIVDRTSPVSRWRRRQQVAKEIALVLPIQLNTERALDTLLSIKDEYDRPSVNARMNLAERKVTESREGWLLDLDASVEAIRQAIERGERGVSLTFEKLRPARTTEQLAGVQFDHVLAAFETRYDKSHRAKARTYNLRVAASKLDGYVLLPGEIFDFNRIVGPRDEANGYKVAPVIAQGEVVDGIGGGTCQISGTLHGAAFFSGLEIVERYPHSRPSSYIKLGLDATVVYPTINFQFRNPHEFPVVLHQTVKDGVVRAEVLGPKLTQTVTLIRRIDSVTPYEQLERLDDRLKQGERVLAQRGMAGFRTKVYRITREGSHATRERWTMSYPPTAQIVRVGTGSPSAATAEDDRHPEYVADELLVLTHRSDAEGAPMRENRVAGRFGRPGWTERFGMPQFKAVGRQEPR